MDVDAALQQVADQVREARARGAHLDLRGGGTKGFYGERVAPGAEVLDLRPLRGITSYEPSELVISALAGTPLSELQDALAGRGQCLPFDPPRFAPGGTLGGMIAAGLSGPARAATGSLRDHVLGAALLNGRGALLHFGGQVMKNVAGFDVSRVLAGSLGVLGVICEVSLKVLARPAARQHRVFELEQDAALRQLDLWAGAPLPLRSSCWLDGRLIVELAGAAAAVAAAGTKMGGIALDESAAAPFWDSLRDQTHPFFRDGAGTQGILWRLSLPAGTPALALDAPVLVEWGGCQRWCHTRAGAGAIRALAAAHGGHATAFRRPATTIDPAVGAVFTPLAPEVAKIHERLKLAFDPDRVFNRGRLYPWL